MGMQSPLRPNTVSKQIMKSLSGYPNRLRRVACVAVTLWMTGAITPSAVASNCTGQCANANTFLTASMVEGIISQAFQEARAQGTDRVTIAVVDRVGNVLGVFESAQALSESAAGANVVINSGRFSSNLPPFTSVGTAIATFGSDPAVQKSGIGGVKSKGLENTQVPSAIAAISKAITGAYLSSEGNAFSSFTAAQIIQEHFAPGVDGQPSGPLFGVQFSQLPCGDLTTQGETVGIGPRRSPLGFSGQRGGLPLYLNGTPVGGIGVISTRTYSIELNINSPAYSTDEAIALAGGFYYQAPTDRMASRITVGGLNLRYTSLSANQIKSNPAGAPSLASVIKSGQGNFVSVPGYYPASDGARRGMAFGQPASGIAPAPAPFKGLGAYVLTDAAKNNRYAPTPGAFNGKQQLTASDVTQLLKNAIRVARTSRSQIRQPLNSTARLSIAVVDYQGKILGILRNQDSPVFSTDVAVQKARTSAFFSQKNTASRLNGTVLAKYVTRAQSVIIPTAEGKFLANGYAVTPRALGNINRPLLPDGISGTPAGPFSLPYQTDTSFSPGSNVWSPFNTGLPLDLVFTDLLYAITNPYGTAPQQPIQDCALSIGDSVIPGSLANGIQAFAGGVPIYKGGVLVGAIGESGDGVDQDDMAGFLSAYQTGLNTKPQVTNANKNIRSNRLTFNNGRSTVALRFVQCPFKPFVNSDTQKACGTK